MPDVIYEMSRKKLGVTTVVDGEKLVGVISDGDLRRLLEKRGKDVLDLAAGEGAALSQWAAFVDGGLHRYAEDRNRPDLMGTSRMSAHLKFGTIHPRTMVDGYESVYRDILGEL